MRASLLFKGSKMHKSTIRRIAEQQESSGLSSESESSSLKGIREIYQEKKDYFVELLNVIKFF